MMGGQCKAGPSDGTSRCVVEGIEQKDYRDAAVSALIR